MLREIRAYLTYAVLLVACCRMIPFLHPQNVSTDLHITIEQDGRIESYPLEKYVQGVLSAEMPESFQLEALKAQAVAARTYALKTAKSRKHTSFEICTDSRCCQGFRPDGLTSDFQSKSYQAVAATEGEVLVYENRLIEAAFFASSGGKTEDARAVWGNYYPYLVSLDSPEESAEYSDKTYTFTKAQLEWLLDIPSETVLTVSDIQFTPGNGIKTVIISGRSFSGTQLRQKLSLPSTYMEITVLEDQLIVHTRGHGHRVGLSQLGAQSMALAGSDYRQILAYYYPSTEIQKNGKIS